MDFLIVNGQVEPKSEVNLTSVYRENSFRLAKKTWFGYGGIPLLSENVNHLIDLLVKLRLSVPEVLTNKRELFRITKRMLNKNKFYRSGLINLEFLWRGEDTHFIISAEPFTQFEFPFEERGVLVSFSSQKLISGNELARFPFSHSTIWKISELDIKDSTFENSIILNEKDAICECINGNIFMIKDKSLFTPALTSGCYEDTIRKAVIKTAAGLGLKISAQTVVEKKIIMEADELFIAGEEIGFHWILGVENKRYLHQYVDLIHKTFDEKLKEEAT